MDKLTYLREVDLFGSLSEEELRECEREFPMIRAPRGSVVLTPVYEREVLYIVKEGIIRLYRLSHDGRELTLGRLHRGDVFGTLPLFGSLSRNTFAEADSDVVLCQMTEQHLEGLIRRHAEVAMRLLRIVGERLASAEDQLEDLAFRSAEQRIARSLLRLVKEEGTDRLEVSHEDLARAAGLARETVTKILGAMERKGWVETGYRWLKLSEPDRITEAGGD